MILNKNSKPKAVWVFVAIPWSRFAADIPCLLWQSLGPSWANVCIWSYMRQVCTASRWFLETEQWFHFERKSVATILKWNLGTNLVSHSRGMSWKLSMSLVPSTQTSVLNCAPLCVGAQTKLSSRRLFSMLTLICPQGPSMSGAWLAELLQDTQREWWCETAAVCRSFQHQTPQGSRLVSIKALVSG